jgi:hypothetical protein
LTARLAAIRAREAECAASDAHCRDVDHADRRYLLARLEELAGALERIERWFGEFPDTGRTWDDGSPMSYGAAFGSSGERDFMREIARAALARLTEDG